MYIWVDDLREAPEDWEWAKNFEQTIDLIRLGFEGISLDHDLGESYNGYDVVKFIEFNDLWPDVIAIHSGNPVGRDNIRRAIEYSGQYGSKQIVSIGDWTGIEMWRKL